MANVTIQQIAGGAKTAPVGTDTLEIQETAGGTSKYATLANLTKGLAAATTTSAGTVELTTDAEYTAGTDTTRATTAANAKVELDKKVAKAGSWEMVIAVGDETTATTTGTAKVTFRMPRAITLTDVRASLTTAGTGTVTTVDINEGGTTILSTKLTIDATEKTSTTAATAAVISDAALADDAEMTIDVDGVGTSAAGLKVTLIGTPA